MPRRSNVRSRAQSARVGAQPAWGTPREGPGKPLHAIKGLGSAERQTRQHAPTHVARRLGHAGKV
jgi:hypothetical protein